MTSAPSWLVNIDEEVSREAGVLHSEMRRTKKDFGLADAYVLAIALRIKSKVLTGGLQFDGVKEAILIQ
ncbi:MAG: hypothetical protein WBV70_04190 [Candidatus Bathyarchaeia archaeon]